MPTNPVVLLLPAAVLAYAVIALAVARWWLSGLVALAVAFLMWRRHPRARFSAYILLSAVALRGLFSRSWRALAFAVVVLALMQTPAAWRAWPRLRPGARPGRGRKRDGASDAGDARGGDRMAGP